MADGVEREREPEDRRAAGLHPIGEALRSTYHADNHDTLGKDLTGLMLELARVEPPASPAPASPPLHPPAAAAAPVGWWERLFGRRRRAG